MLGDPQQYNWRSRFVEIPGAWLAVCTTSQPTSGCRLVVGAVDLSVAPGNTVIRIL